jgi:hypothetical protein
MKSPPVDRVSRAVLWLIFTLWIITGAAIFLFPKTFYDVTPGVTLFGPFNIHFIRDVGLVYLSSGLIGLWGIKRDQAQQL